MSKLPTGVRFIGQSVGINFQHNGKRTQLYLDLPQTLAGAKMASKIRADLVDRAKLGILTDEDLARAKGGQAHTPKAKAETFEHFADKYLKRTTANADSATGYARMLKQKWVPAFKGQRIDSITPGMIRDAIDDWDFATAKTKNNNLIPLRGVFDLAFQDGAIPSNPMDLVKNDRIQEEDPDPFTREEAEAILAWLEDNVEPVYFHYYTLAFWTGCRPSELLALHWPDFDRFNDTLTINKSRVRGVEKNVTKTHTSRVIHLNPRAREALDKLFQDKDDPKHIFICPETGKPFFNEKPPRVRFVKALDALGIRHRRAYNTRHTYATLLLSSGVTPFFASDQMGHSLQMMLKRYAKWVDVARSKAEIAKLNV